MRKSINLQIHKISSFEFYIYTRNVNTVSAKQNDILLWCVPGIKLYNVEPRQHSDTQFSRRTIYKIIITNTNKPQEHFTNILTNS